MFYHHSSMNNNKCNKSSSYPSFVSSNTGVLTNNAINNASNYNAPDSLSSIINQESQTHGIQKVVHAFNESYSNSISNSMPMQQPFIMQKAIQVISKAVPQHDEKFVLNNNETNDGTGNDKNRDQNNIGDINSRLEFLCLQMTEQAIN